jgi:hypothetical protein
MSAVVVAGAGPAETCLVERICAKAARLGGGQALDVHLVDPYPPGGGRLWRSSQPGALRIDSAAGDLTVFPDSVGPSLADWLDGQPRHAVSRSVVGGYLAYAFERAVRLAPGNVPVHLHRARAIGLTESLGRQRVELSTGGSLEAASAAGARGRPAWRACGPLRSEASGSRPADGAPGFGWFLYRVGAGGEGDEADQGHQ